MSSVLEADATAATVPQSPAATGYQDVGYAKYTREQEDRVVRKLDWNLMTLFFVLCELINIEASVYYHGLLSRIAYSKNHADISFSCVAKTCWHSSTVAISEMPGLPVWTMS